MALVLKDRVLETCTSPGTGTVTLLGAVTGYQSFSTVGNGNTCYYAIADQSGANWEVGIGTYSTAGTLARTTVLSSSNGGNLTNFSTGSQNVFLTYPSSRSVNLSSAALTSGRVAYATTDGLLTDSANLTFNGTTLTANTIGAYTLSGTIAGGGNQLNNIIIGTSTPLAGSFTTINASTSITNAGLTSGRVTYAGTAGLLQDSANLTFDGTNLLLNAATPNLQGTSSTGSVSFVNNSGGAFIRLFGGSHATRANYTDFINGASTSTFASSGNLGIGNSNPDCLISVEGADGAVGGAIRYTATGVCSAFMSADPNGLCLATDTAGITFRTAVTGNDPTDTGSERMRITSAGSVWIGTTSGNYQLHVTTDMAVGASGFNQQLSFTNDTIQSLILGTGYTALKLNPLGGNVGIGTTSPAFKTEIVGGATTVETTLFQVRSDAGGIGTGTTIALANSTNASAGSGRVELAGIRDTASGSSFVIRTADSVGTITERMRIDSSGNVGIGTSNPSSYGKLAVDGTIINVSAANTTPFTQQRISVYNDGGNWGYLGYGNDAIMRIVYSSTASSYSLLFGTTSATNNTGTFTETLRISNTGALVLKGGTSAPTGVGVTFPATQVASPDANTLDDYEEGTWTPFIAGDGTAFAGTSYNYRTGKYVKVGDVVWVSYDIHVNNAGTLSSTASVGGLPFPVPNSSDLSNGGGSLTYVNGLQQSYVYQSCYPQNQSSYLYIIGRTAASTQTTVVNAADFFANSVRFSGMSWYRTTV